MAQDRHQDLGDEVAADNEIAIPDIGKSGASRQATSTREAHLNGQGDGRHGQHPDEQRRRQATGPDEHLRGQEAEEYGIHTSRQVPPGAPST